MSVLGNIYLGFLTFGSSDNTTDEAQFECQCLVLLLLLLTGSLALCSHQELINTLGLEWFRNSQRTYKGRMSMEDGSSQHVIIQVLHGMESSSFATWLDWMSQLQHPHLLPIVGACTERPPAIVTPFMPVCKLSLPCMLFSSFLLILTITTKVVLEMWLALKSNLYKFLLGIIMLALVHGQHILDTTVLDCLVCRLFWESM